VIIRIINIRFGFYIGTVDMQLGVTKYAVAKTFPSDIWKWVKMATFL